MRAAQTANLALCGQCWGYHGRCIETCSESSYQCTAEGASRSGYTETVYGFSGNWRYAEDQAIRNCADQGLYGCYIRHCSQQNQVVSRTRC